MTTKLPSTGDVLSEAFARLQEEHANKEEKKKGVLRAGNSGLLEGEEFAGQCPRLAFLRSQGIAVDGVDEEQNLMFEGGLGNEDLWVEALQKVWPGKIKQEEEIPIRWETPNGTLVTGRPDIVLCDKRGNPVRGLELKLVCSVWTARTILSGQPKLAHLTQAAHYSWKLGEQLGREVPFELWYTSRVNWPVMQGWMAKLFPAVGDRNSEYLEYKIRKDRGGNEHVEPFKIMPFRLGFEVRFDPDYVPPESDEGNARDVMSGANETEGGKPDGLSGANIQFRQIGTRDWTTSLVSRKRIADFYDFVSKMEAEKRLGARPKALKVDGHKENYSPCDYCPAMRSICDSERSFDKWYAAVKEKFVES